MLNPALMEMLARERITQLQHASAKPTVPAHCSALVDDDAARVFRLSIRRGRLARPQAAFGWFLISVGLRLAVPRSGARATR